MTDQLVLSGSQQHNLAKYGEWAIVTGASNGIGLEFAKQLASLGFKLILIARRQAQLDALTIELQKTYGTQTLVLAEDLNDSLSLPKIIRASLGKNIGLLVANAGFGTSGPLINSDIAVEMNMIQVNCSALFYLTNFYAKQFAEQRRGGIILMSSLIAFQGTPNSANYAATKAYVQTLAEALHVELKPLGVDVLASAPGPVNTGFAARSNMQMGYMETAAVVAKVTLAALGKTATVRPGVLAKFLGYSLSAAPRWLRVKIMAGIMGGMTKHQQYK